MSGPEILIVGAGGALIGVLTATGLVGPTVMFSDAFYAMTGVVVSSIVGATATVLVTLITTRTNRRSRDDEDEPPRRSR